ncbi:DUF664 domain-containing protein [Kineococcus sp. R8]|uniref:DinB family protein n=1 Tax=Kineococcus siccus TaxID=2696567 RepID=UPI001412AF2C|nr:DinB family protein [Kineococcus siccus]NAZ83439.1 DUF664 domain-containing protein [Kineococcus siccus]
MTTTSGTTTSGTTTSGTTTSGTTTSGTTTSATTTGSTDERADLLESLARHRWFLTFTVRDLSDEQARLRPTVSALSLGGLVKHVAAIEDLWARFLVDGPAAMGAGGDEWADGFTMAPRETLDGLLAEYAAVAARTDELVRTLPDLGASQALPPAPWFEPGARWSARRVLLHVLAETSQHAGHADVLRESIDGARTMG